MDLQKKYEFTDHCLEMLFEIIKTTPPGWLREDYKHEIIFLVWTSWTC